MKVCEGEYDMAWDTLMSMTRSCSGSDISFFVLDDASPSKVGRRLAENFHKETQNPVDCLELPKSLGFRGSARRAFMGLERIAKSGEVFDVVVKIDADGVVVRDDLGRFMKEACPDGMGLFGEQYPMRLQDKVLYFADLLPIGFKRKSVDEVIQREWQLSRFYPVWWSDLGRQSLRNGFRFSFIPGCFWFLGGRTLQMLSEAGYLSRDQSRYGFVFNDDLLLTMAVFTIKHPVVDLGALSPHWGRFQAMTEDAPISAIKPHRPFVIHPLKDNPKAWERRRELREMSMAGSIERF